MVVGGWKKEPNRLVSSEAVFQPANAAKVSCCLFTRNNESISRARLWAPLQLYSITASQAKLELKVSPEDGGYMLHAGDLCGEAHINIFSLSITSRTVK